MDIAVRITVRRNLNQAHRTLLRKFLLNFSLREYFEMDIFRSLSKGKTRHFPPFQCILRLTDVIIQKIKRRTVHVDPKMRPKLGG